MLSFAALLCVLFLLFLIRKNSYLHLFLLVFSIPFETYVHWDIGFALKPAQLFAMTTFISLILNKEMFTPSFKSQIPFLLILFAAAISLINAPWEFIFRGFHGGLRMMFNISLQYFIAYVISVSIKDAKILKGVILTYVIALFLSVLIEVGRAHLGGWEMLHKEFDAVTMMRGGYTWLPSISRFPGYLRLTPNMMPQNQYAAMLTIALTFIATLGIYKQIKVRSGVAYLLPVFFTLCSYGLILTFTRTAWLSSLVALFILLLYSKKQELHKGILYGGLCLTGTTLLLLSIYPKNVEAVFERAAAMPVYRALSGGIYRSDAVHSVVDGSIAPRVDGFLHFIELFKAHPIIGSGWASTSTLHNSFLQILCDAGIVGLTVFLAFIFYIFFNLYKSCNKPDGEMKFLSIGIIAALVGNMIYLMAEPNGHYQIHVWFVIGLGLSIIRLADMGSGRDYAAGI